MCKKFNLRVLLLLHFSKDKQLPFVFLGQSGLQEAFIRFITVATFITKAIILVHRCEFVYHRNSLVDIKNVG